MSCCYSALFELLLLGTWPYASYHSVGTFSRSYLTSYSTFELLLLGTWSSAYYQRVDVLSPLLLDSFPCMSGSGNINHPLRDEPGLKTK